MPSSPNPELNDSSPAPSRSSSTSRPGQQHIPAHPSTLRHSEVLTGSPPAASNESTRLLQDGKSPTSASPAAATRGSSSFLADGAASRRPRHFRAYDSAENFSLTKNGWTDIPGTVTPSESLPVENDIRNISATQWLARRHGVPNTKIMYMLYYLPVTNWIRHYRWAYVKGDLVAALTMASFYIPMSLSYATNLGHIPPINGLYSFVFQPFVYALLGTCTQMVVGPEAAGSLLTGQVVRENIKHGHFADSDSAATARIAGAVTGLSGAIILLAGLCRLGFLDSVLSRPFLRGFISSIGIVILVDQLIPEMGLDALAERSGNAAHGSSLQKIIFLVSNCRHAHGLTCAVSFSAFAITMICREAKRRVQPHTPSIAYVPDRFLIVALSATICWWCAWDTKGLDILGDIRGEGRPFTVHFPLRPSFIERIGDAFSTAFLIALLGFFESSVAAKSLGNPVNPTPEKTDDQNDNDDINDDDDDTAERGRDGITLQLSTNRELVALGCANLLGGLFMSLPAFGGYGRSKVNASTGGKTPMSSIFLSIITVICTLFLLPYFYYIPKGVLSAMISVVAYSLIEEAPHDVWFFWSISGYNELFLMLVIVLITIFWNLRVGMAVGIGLSLLRLLRHATRPRIQILGRVLGGGSGGGNDFEDAEASNGLLEFFPKCLIIRIPEPLTFANTGSLKDRLRRLEDHGTNAAHPALPRVRSSVHNKNVIFDVHGVTSLDPAAAQVLVEIVRTYRDRNVRVFFCRVPRWPGTEGGKVWRLMVASGIVAACGGERHFVRTVQDALDLTEKKEGRSLRPVEGFGANDMQNAESSSSSPAKRGRESV